MTFRELINQAHRDTKMPLHEVAAIVLNAWPMREHFTPTQAALVINHIQRKGAQSQ